MFKRTSQDVIRTQPTIRRLLPLAGLLASALGATALAQSVPFPTYTVGQNKDGSKGPDYPSTLPTPWIASSGQVLTPAGTQVYLGTTTRAKAVALNPTANHTAAVLQMGAPQAVTIFNTQTGAILQSYSAAAGKDRDGSSTGITYTSDGKYLLFSQDGSSGSGSFVGIASVSSAGLLTDYAQVSVPIAVNAANVLTTVTCFPNRTPIALAAPRLCPSPFQRRIAHAPPYQNGQLALKAAELFEQFLTIIHPGGQATRVLDKSGAVLLDVFDDGTGGRPEVPRGELRRILLESLPDGTVQWRRKVRVVAPLGNGHHEITFADGSTSTTELLVGADGAWSKVRPLLSEARPAYAGITYVETYLQDSDIRHRPSAEAVGGGALFATSPGKAILAHRELNGVLHTYVTFKKSEEWMASIDFSNPVAAVTLLAREFYGWDPALIALLTDGETAPILRPIYALPIEHRWSRIPGVTLVGDAAHVTAPSGEGANLAMFDGAELARFIVGNENNVEAALLAYETELFPRSAFEAAQAQHMQEVLFGDNAPQSLLDFFGGHQA